MTTLHLIRRLGLPLLATLALAACDREGGESGWFSRTDARTVSVSAGDAELDESGRLDFEVSSDVYRRWTLAQRALGRSETVRYVASLGRRALTQAELDRAVERVQRDARARSAIEGAGMTPLEYVYATVAIEQAMAVATGRLAPRKGERGVPQQNVDIVGQHQDEILRGGVIGDTSVIVLPDEPVPTEPVPAPVPVPSPQPLPPTPRDPLPPPDTPRPPAPRDPIPSDPVPQPPAPTPSPTPTPTPVPPSEPTPAPPQPDPDPPAPSAADPAGGPAPKT